jgi:hypothetical protein
VEYRTNEWRLTSPAILEALIVDTPQRERCARPRGPGRRSVSCFFDGDDGVRGLARCLAFGNQGNRCRVDKNDGRRRISSDIALEVVVVGEIGGDSLGALICGPRPKRRTSGRSDEPAPEPPQVRSGGGRRRPLSTEKKARGGAHVRSRLTRATGIGICRPGAGLPSHQDSRGTIAPGETHRAERVTTISRLTSIRYRLTSCNTVSFNVIMARSCSYVPYIDRRTFGSDAHVSGLVSRNAHAQSSGENQQKVVDAGVPPVRDSAHPSIEINVDVGEDSPRTSRVGETSLLTTPVKWTYQSCVLDVFTFINAGNRKFPLFFFFRRIKRGRREDFRVLLSVA